MATIPPTDDPQKIEKIGEILMEAEQKGTPGAEALMTFGQNPEIAKAFFHDWDTAFYGGLVDHKIKELVRARLAQLHNCEYCLSVGSNVAKKMGLTDEKMKSLDEYERNPNFTETERVALRFADDFFNYEHNYDDLKGYFSNPEIIELAWFIALQDGGEKFVSRLELEEVECDIPQPNDAA